MTPLVLVKGKDFILSPQMFEPERSQVEAEKLVKGLELNNKICVPPKQIWVGNKDWCICSKAYRNAMTETEILCPRERNNISDELLKGLFCFFNDCWHSDWRYLSFFWKILLLQNCRKNLYIKTLSNVFREVYCRSSCQEVSWKITWKRCTWKDFQETSVIDFGFQRYRLNKIHPPWHIFSREFFSNFSRHLVLQTNLNGCFCSF